MAGIRVLDLTRLLPGPFCTLMLADLGADVIKIEEPGGDPARRYPPLLGDTGSLFLLVNRNKRSIVLDLKSAAGKERLLAMAAGSDVLVESFRPGVLDRLGVGYDVLAAHNPRLVYCSLSGFGQRGPYRDRPGHDLNYLALAGLLGYNADASRRPFPPAVQVADLGAGTFAAVAILAALLSRHQTGRGQNVDVSLFASAVAWLPTLVASLFATQQADPPGEPMLAGGSAQYDVYTTRDGRYVTLGAIEPRFLANFLTTVDRADLLPLAASGPVGRDRLRDALRGIFASRTVAEWTADLAEIETCFAPVNALPEALHDPQVRALELVSSVTHARLGELGQLAPPFSLSETPATIRRPPPDLDEHASEVLAEFGLI